jgi:hypothetical protein
MKLRIFYFITAAWCTQAAFSQAPAPSPQPVFNVQYRVLSWQGGIWNLYNRPSAPNEEPEFFTVPSYMPSPWFQYTGPLPIPLFQKGETQTLPPPFPGGEEVEVPRPVAALTPQGSGKWLFLLIRDKDENGDLMYKSFAVKDESLDLSEGYLFVNLSPSELAVMMNDDLQAVGPNQRHHFVPNPNNDGTVDLKIAENQNGEWKLVNTNTLIMPKQGLTTVYLTKIGRKIWMRRFVDSPPTEEASQRR